MNSSNNWVTLKFSASVYFFLVWYFLTTILSGFAAIALLALVVNKPAEILFWIGLGTMITATVAVFNYFCGLLGIALNKISNSKSLVIAEGKVYLVADKTKPLNEAELLMSYDQCTFIFYPYLAQRVILHTGKLNNKMSFKPWSIFVPRNEKMVIPLLLLKNEGELDSFLQKYKTKDCVKLKYDN